MTLIKLSKSFSLILLHRIKIMIPFTMHYWHTKYDTTILKVVNKVEIFIPKLRDHYDNIKNPTGYLNEESKFLLSIRLFLTVISHSLSLCCICPFYRLFLGISTENTNGVKRILGTCAMITWLDLKRVYDEFMIDLKPDAFRANSVVILSKSQNWDAFITSIDRYLCS